MAVTITRKAPRNYSTDCGRCGCSFSYQLDDVHRNYVRGGEFVHCPSCSNSIRHPSRWAQ